MRTIATMVATVAMALGALGMAVAAPGRDEAPEAAVTAAAGAVRITNSRDGQAVVAAGAMRPGQTATGTVRIGNDGDVPGRFALRPTALTDAPGPYGGRMSRWAELVLRDVTGSRTLYTGAPADLGELDLGTLAAGERRDYSIALTLPDGGVGGGDDRYQGSALSLGLQWLAAPVEVEPPVETPQPPVPTPPGTTPPGTTPPGTTPPGTTPHATDPTGEALGDVLGLPSATRCVSRRRFTIRLHAPGSARVVSAVISIKGKKPVRVNGGRSRAPVNLRGLPKGKVKVKLTVRASNGRTYKSTRMYRTCAAKSKKAKKPRTRKRS